MFGDSRQSFEFSRLNSLLSSAFHDKKKTKSIGITNGSVVFKYYESDLDTSNTSFAELCFPCIDSFAFMKSKSNGHLLKILHKNLNVSAITSMS